jgi:hypothetical protein
MTKVERIFPPAAGHPRRAARSALSSIALCALLAGVATTTGCRVTDDDVHKWESTARGPDRLRAVLAHDKYDNNLRVEAALSLVRMKPRAGRRVGIGMMVETLASLPPETRQQLVAALVPAIITELKKPPTAGQAGQAAPPDPSYPYKDAAYAMLTVDRTVIADEGLKASLKAALVEWAMADFEHRLDNRTQAYGMEQLLRFIGPAAVIGLPKLMTRDARRLDQMATLVAELGDQKTKDAASAALVSIANYVLSDEWRKLQTPLLEAANKASKQEPTPPQFQIQLATFQDEELLRDFGAMKKVGGRPAVDFLLTNAAKKDWPEKRRVGALAALEQRLDKKNPDDVKRILDIAASDAPDGVLDQAFRRIGEMPRDAVVGKLYDQFKTDKWKVRRAAAATVLKMSKVKDIDDFMGHLPEGRNEKGFAMPEALTYGADLGSLKDGDAYASLKKWFDKGSGAQRASALSWFFTFGTTANLKALQAYEDERINVPTCEAEDCKWSCDVPKDNGKDHETKDIKTLGEFVKYCLEPTVKDRKPEEKKPEPKK